MIKQNASDWEWLFIDDGSDDSSFELAQNAANGDPRCVFLKNNTGVKGGNAARNLGIDFAKSEYVMFLDSDDLLSPNCVERRLADFEKYPEMDMLVYPTGVFMDTLGDSDLLFNIPSDVEDLNRFLDRDIVWQTSGPIWKRKALLEIGCFDLKLLSQQDVDLHIRALISGLNYTYLHKEPDVFYRRNIDSIPRSSSQTLPHLRMRFEMILRHIHLLSEANKLDENRKMIMARQILDLAQMMRWHIEELGKEARKEALGFWSKAHELHLMNYKIFKLGKRYIRFKHNMMYNRIPRIQKELEDWFSEELNGYLFKPQSTHLNCTLTDYEG